MTRDVLLPTPAWRLKEIMRSDGKVSFVIFKYATYRTNEELSLYRYDDGRLVARLSGTEGKDVTDRLPQERWADIYNKAIAALTLLGRTPEIIEEIF
jgi:hypothetical protein